MSAPPRRRRGSRARPFEWACSSSAPGPSRPSRTSGRRRLSRVGRPGRRGLRPRLGRAGECVRSATRRVRSGGTDVGGGTYEAQGPWRSRWPGHTMKAATSKTRRPEPSLGDPAVRVRPGPAERLVLGGTSISERTYLAVQGGWRTPIVLGSRSPEERGSGRATSCPPRRGRPPSGTHRRPRPRASPRPPTAIRVLDGPDAAEAPRLGLGGVPSGSAAGRPDGPPARGRADRSQSTLAPERASSPWRPARCRSRGDGASSSASPAARWAAIPTSPTSSRPTSTASDRPGPATSSGSAASRSTRPRIDREHHAAPRATPRTRRDGRRRPDPDRSSPDLSLPVSPGSGTSARPSCPRTRRPESGRRM